MPTRTPAYPFTSCFIDWHVLILLIHVVEHGSLQNSHELTQNIYQRSKDSELGELGEQATELGEQVGRHLCGMPNLFSNGIIAMSNKLGIAQKRSSRTLLGSSSWHY